MRALRKKRCGTIYIKTNALISCAILHSLSAPLFSHMQMAVFLLWWLSLSCGFCGHFFQMFAFAFQLVAKCTKFIINCLLISHRDGVSTEV